MNITHNNVLYDGIISEGGDVPVKRVKGLDQLYPVGSVCCLNLVPDGSTHTMFLRSELRLQAEWASPVDGPISLVGGKSIKVESLSQLPKDYEELIALYERIRSISTVNLPDIDVKSQKAAVVKVLELMTGYLCTLSFFSQDKLYTIFKTANLQDRIPLLLSCYREYLDVLE